MKYFIDGKLYDKEDVKKFFGNGIFLNKVRSRGLYLTNKPIKSNGLKVNYGRNNKLVLLE